MAFENPVRNLVIPSGAGTGSSRIVIGPDIPEPLKSYLWAGVYPVIGAVIYYKANGDYIFEALIDAATQTILVRGSVIGGTVLEVGIGSPAGIDIRANSSSAKTVFDIMVNTVDPGNSAFLPIYGQDPDDSTFVDVWTPISFSAGPGWTGTVKTRHTASPPNEFRMVGALAMGGTKANGTTIGTITDANRRPTTAQDIACSCNNVVAGGESPHLNLQPDGRVICYGFTAATVGFANGSYATDW